MRSPERFGIIGASVGVRLERGFTTSNFGSRIMEVFGDDLRSEACRLVDELKKELASPKKRRFRTAAEYLNFATLKLFLTPNEERILYRELVRAIRKAENRDGRDKDPKQSGHYDTRSQTEKDREKKQSEENCRNTRIQVEVYGVKILRKVDNSNDLLANFDF